MKGTFGWSSLAGLIRGGTKYGTALSNRQYRGVTPLFDAKKLAEPRPCPRCGAPVVLVDTTSGLCKVCFDGAVGTGEIE